MDFQHKINKYQVLSQKLEHSRVIINYREKWQFECSSFTR